ASITEGDARLGPHVVMRYLIAGTAIMKVICSLCGTEQDVQQNCMNCGVCMGNYFCHKCKFFDDDVSKEQYHCDECECCYSNLITDIHHCVEKAMHHNCPVCFEVMRISSERGLTLCCYWSQFLFDSTKNLTVLPCGHTMHLECLKEMELHHR
ncbi:hypothetical protein RD792_006847, partial [Penstemon davidsonii]